jgi:hypothetical protein
LYWLLGKITDVFLMIQDLTKTQLCSLFRNDAPGDNCILWRNLAKSSFCSDRVCCLLTDRGLDTDQWLYKSTWWKLLQCFHRQLTRKKMKICRPGVCIN